MPAEFNLPPTVAWKDGRVCLIDQTKLPDILEIVSLDDWRSVVEAIQNMVVRGAPAIGCTAALGLTLGARSLIAPGRKAFLERLAIIGNSFRAARPTAVNLDWAIDRLLFVANQTEGATTDLKAAIQREAIQMLEEDLEVNRRLGQYGAALLAPGANVLTHCNAGALATVGYGTALGVIRAAVEDNKTIHVYADETRPRLQGMKLTAWELMQDRIAVTIIADNMSAVLLRDGKIDCVIVGADRIAENGDTANKIGTYGLAALARYHNVPFYVAAPASSFDMSLPDGAHIPIEERDSHEMTHINGIRIAPEGAEVLNPSFDVTPASLVSGFITEFGVLEPPYSHSLVALKKISAGALEEAPC